MKITKENINVGDYVYQLHYYSKPFGGADRSVERMKIIKLNPLSIKLSDKRTIAYHAINNDFLDDWYSSRELMYKGKLNAHLKEYKYVFDEIKYLKKKSSHNIKNHEKEN